MLISVHRHTPDKLKSAQSRPCTDTLQFHLIESNGFSVCPQVRTKSALSHHYVLMPVKSALLLAYWTVSAPKSMRISSCTTYHDALTMHTSSSLCWNLWITCLLLFMVQPNSYTVYWSKNVFIKHQLVHWQRRLSIEQPVYSLDVLFPTWFRSETVNISFIWYRLVVSYYRQGNDYNLSGVEYLPLFIYL